MFKCNCWRWRQLPPLNKTSHCFTWVYFLSKLKPQDFPLSCCQTDGWSLPEQRLYHPTLKHKNTLWKRSWSGLLFLNNLSTDCSCDLLPPVPPPYCMHVREYTQHLALHFTAVLHNVPKLSQTNHQLAENMEARARCKTWTLCACLSRSTRSVNGGRKALIAKGTPD